MILWGATQNGPAVLPGSYSVRLNADGVTQTQPFQVLKHPLRPISDADLQFQWNLASRIRDKVNEANNAIIRIRRIKTEIADRIKDAPAEVRSAGEQLTKALATVEEDVYQVKNQSGQDPLNFPIKTNNRLASLLRVAVSGEGRPTGNVEPIFNDLIAELKAETDRLEKTVSDQLPPFNRMLERIKKAPVDGK
jgi:cell division septum initiation protein DivIVA